MRRCTGGVSLIFFLSMMMAAQQSPSPQPQETQPAPSSEQAPAAPQGQTPSGQQPAGNQGQQGTGAQTQQAPGAPETPEVPEPQSPPEPRPMPRFEVFAGYSYFAADPFSLASRSPLHGWQANLTINAARWLGFVADFGGNYGTAHIPVAVPTPFPPCPPFCPLTTSTFPVNTHMFTYLFGVKLPYRKWNNFTPFAQLLYGRAHVRGEDLGQSEIDTKGALSGGLGVDYAITQRFAWRIEGDYVRTKFFRLTQDNYRVSTGIVFHWTRKKKKRTLVTP
ncbi:MAG TPA: outer membrane beta-barrel protein [Terriglobales bacterium]|nr:outer membrane beta-barrel protein [Terriglobales bacterium]